MKNKYLEIAILSVLIALCSYLVYFTVSYEKKPKLGLNKIESTSTEFIEPKETKNEAEEIIQKEEIVEEKKEEVKKETATPKKEETKVATTTSKSSSKSSTTTKKKNQLRTYKLGKVDYNKKITIKSVIKVNTSGNLDTTKLGSFTKKVKVKNVTYTIKYEVVDRTAPIILGGNKTVTKGSKTNLKNKFLCGDNYDDVPKCEIIGDYDLNKVGKYKLKYRATDSSGNRKQISFTLTVKEKSSSSSSSSSSTKKGKPISNYVKKYKNKNTMIGVDVSSWQDEIDWKKAKKAGVEFAIIRIGFGHTNSGELKMDKQFKNNIKNAKKNGIKVGLYFFSYAENEKQGKEHAEWIINQLDGEKLDLPVAFDWENWNDFNSYKMSFTRVHNTAQTFITTLEKAGYKGMLYSSAYYLTRLWGSNFKNQWLAYYTDKNDYTEKPFMMWQATSSGKVDGIPGFVDIDILYKNKIK